MTDLPMLGDVSIKQCSPVVPCRALKLPDSGTLGVIPANLGVGGGPLNDIAVFTVQLGVIVQFFIRHLLPWDL